MQKSFHEMKGDRDGKSVQQDTAYSAVVVNDHMYPRPCLYHSNMTLFGSKTKYRDGDTYDHSLQLHYIGSILLHSFLLIYHPYPPSFHEMIFALVPLIFLC